MVELVYYVTLKSIINRIRKYPFMILGFSICIFVVLLIPFFCMGEGYAVQIPNSIINAFFLFYFSYCLFKIAREKNSFRMLPTNIEMLIIQVPEKTKKVFKCLVADTVIKSIFSYGIIFVCIKLYTKDSIENIFLGLMMLTLNIFSLVLISSIIDLVSLVKKSKIVKIVIGVLGLYFGVCALLELCGIKLYGTVFDNILPFYIYAASFSYILGSRALKSLLVLQSVTFFLFLLCIYSWILHRVKLRPSDILASQQMTCKGAKYIGILRIEHMLKFLPLKIRLLCVKEIVQIISEKYALLNVFIQTIIAASIMIISAITVEIKAMQMGIYVALAYLGFIIALYSIPRETNTIWIYKTTGIKHREFAFAKFLVNCLVSSILSIAIFLSYIFLVIVFSNTGTTYIESISYGYLWSIGTMIPLSTIWGIIVGAILPYKVIVKKQKITYKFNGLEGLVLMILVFVVVVPGYLISQTSSILIFDLCFLLYVILIFLCMINLAGKAYKKMG